MRSPKEANKHNRGVTAGNPRTGYRQQCVLEEGEHRRLCFSDGRGRNIVQAERNESLLSIAEAQPILWHNSGYEYFTDDIGLSCCISVLWGGMSKEMP